MLMNNRHFISLLLSLLLLVTSCSREVEDRFGNSAYERLRQSSEELSEYLVSSADGWVMEYYPTHDISEPQGAGYLILMKVRADGSVSMAMKNAMTGGFYLQDESLWEIRKDDGVVLSFPSYNKCLHLFSDPSVGDIGNGLEGDYEFVYSGVENTTGSILLKGKKRGVCVRMSPLSGCTSYEGYLDDIEDFKSSLFPLEPINNNQLTIGDSVFVVSYLNDDIPCLCPVNGDPVSDCVWNPYLITRLSDGYHLRFRDVIEAGSLSVREFVYDADRSLFRSVDGCQAVLSGPDPYEFFTLLAEYGYSWTLSVNGSEMSEALCNAFMNVSRQCEELPYNYTLGEVTVTPVMTMTGGISFYLGLEFLKNGRYLYTAFYLYDCLVLRDSLSLSSPVAYDNQSAHLLTVLDSVEDLLELFKGVFILSGSPSGFNMKELKATSVDGSVWFKFSLME